VLAFCTACGGLRGPLAGPSINLAGQPSKVGGAVARVAGWIVLVFGGALALGIGGLIAAIFSALVGLAFALPILVVSGVAGVALLRGGRQLRRSGMHAERATREQALLAMAAAGPVGRGRRYGVTAKDAARSLGISVDEADGMLTALAKSDPDRLTLDLDDQGVIWYRSLESPAPRGRRVRVDADASASEDASAHGEDDPADAALDDLARSSRR
jgi:hypothetical protein